MSDRAPEATVTIRAAQFDDASRLAELSEQLGYPTTPDGVRHKLQRITSDAEHEVWVAESSGGEVLGWIDLLVERALVSGNEVEMAGLVVDEACRGQGVGRRLMELRNSGLATKVAGRSGCGPT